MSSTSLFNNSGVFLTGLTIKGASLLKILPETLPLDDNQIKSLAMKSLPIGGECGDVVNLSLQNYQAIAMLFLVPPFEENTIDQRETHVALGMIIDKDINPIPFKKMLGKIRDICQTKGTTSYKVLESIAFKFYQDILINNQSHFFIKINDNNTTFYFDTELFDIRSKRGAITSEDTKGKRFSPVLSCDEIMKREQSSFMLDKFILKTICEKSPVSIEEIRVSVMPMEKVLGSRIDLATIEEVIRKYLSQGLIKIS